MSVGETCNMALRGRMLFLINGGNIGNQVEDL